MDADNRTPAKVAAQLQQDMFAHPSAGPIPVAASTVELAIQELRRLQTACDKHSESDLLLEGRTQPDVVIDSDAIVAARAIASDAFGRRWSDAEEVAKELLRLFDCEGGVIRRYK